MFMLKTCPIPPERSRLTLRPLDHATAVQLGVLVGVGQHGEDRLGGRVDDLGG